MTKDMTRGNPFWLILGFCLPMVCGNLFQQLYNLVDSIIVGQYVGVKAFSGVGSVGSVYFLVIGTATGICSGFAIPIAQRFGAEDFKGMRKTVYNAEMLAAVISVLMMIVTVLFCRPLLTLMKTPSDTFEYALSYIRIIFLGIPITVFYNMLSSLLRALGDSRTPLRYLLISSLLNVVFDLLFIITLGMGVTGAAAATVLSQFISGLLCFRFIKTKLPILGYEENEKVIDTALMKKILSLGLPMAFQFSITAIGTIILQTAVNTLGSGIVAATTAGSKIQTLVIQPMETLGVTMATYGGQNLGAGKIDRIREGARQALCLQVIYTVTFAVIIYFFGDLAANIFIKNDEPEYKIIMMNVKHYLQVTSVFYPVLGVLFLFRNLLQGLGFSAVTLLAGVVELIARSIVSFGFVYRIGFEAACFASPVAWTAAALLLVYLYVYEIKRLIHCSRHGEPLQA
ncbi:putative efflux protein, MATE family [Ruminococcus sp. YE71]|uniref:MATE family efflux transporter n=1 Tax=unclassified Ruminococcus TaxID=2608920 RepID=UPI000885AA6C|nr:MULTISPECIES: MATE family efflux transporter [unclassified Ruminococcus]SDA18385.1 putative efflux protein, MATE family [Ruminococcus sp. YE78]SFW30017.1 putative efflux protein, MATE family [Ruminococcus sp. YE71]